MKDRRNAGFTLIESIIVVALIGLLTSAVSGFYVQSMATFRSGSVAQQVQSDLRHAMNYMVRELQGASTASLVSDNYSHLDYGNGRFFRQVGNTIQRHDNQPLSQYVGELEFDVFSVDGAPRRVGIKVTSVSSLPGRPNEAGLPYVLQTSVALRNLTVPAPDDPSDPSDPGDPAGPAAVGPDHPGYYTFFNAGSHSISLPSGSTVHTNIYSASHINLASNNSEVWGSVISLQGVTVSSGTTVHGNVCALGGNVSINSSNSTVHGNVNASGNVSVGSGGQVKGYIRAAGDVELNPSDAMVYGEIHSGGSVTIKSATTAHQDVIARLNITLLNSHNSTQGIQGNAHSGSTISRGGSTTISGSSYDMNDSVPPRRLPLPPDYCIDPIAAGVSAPPFQTITPGSSDVNVRQSTSEVLAPGSYRNLTFNWNSTVTLSGGVYHFNRISGTTSNLTLRLDLSSNLPLTIFVVDNLAFTGHVEVSEDGTNYTRIKDLDLDTAKRLARRVYWETHRNFTISGSGVPRWFGTVLARNDISLASGFFGVGAHSVGSQGRFSFTSPIEMHYSLADFAVTAWR